MIGFIGLDLGSTAVKGVAIATDGRITSTVSSQVVFNVHTNDSIKEIDADYYIGLIASIIEELSRSLTSVIAVSWVTASGNLILLDDQNEVLTPIMSWLDTQPSDAGISLSGFSAEEFYRIVGWPFSVQFPYGRLLWLNKNSPDLIARTASICQHHQYVGYVMTGRHLIDQSTATTGYLADQHTRTYYQPFLETLGIKMGMLAEIVPVSTVLGPITDSFKEQSGLTCKPSVVLGSFDHPGAARALGIKRTDQLMLSCGTSWVGFCVLPDRETGLKRKLLVDPYEEIDGGSWAGMFSVTGAGQYFDKWMKVFYHTDEITKHMFLEFDALATTAYEKGVECPLIDVIHMDPQVVLMELSREFSQSAIALSLLESTVFTLIRRMKQVEMSLDDINEVYLVGGPSNSDIWTQLIADILEKDIIVSFGQTAGAVGAAVIAARGMGVRLKPEDTKQRIVSADQQKALQYRKKQALFLDEFLL